MCNVCLIHCNCSCIYNVKFLCIVKALFRVGMHVRPFIFKIRYMLFLKNNAVFLFRHLIIIFPSYVWAVAIPTKYMSPIQENLSCLTISYFICIHWCYYNRNIVYNITMNNVQISVAKGDISLHGACVGHSPFSY